MLATGGSLAQRLSSSASEPHAIFACICAQVADFWHEVELALNVRQASMFQAVNAHLERLARAVNSVVGDLLALRLEPILVRMDPPTAAQFHSSLQELFERGGCSWSESRRLHAVV